MPNARKRKPRGKRAHKQDVAASAYRRLERVAMRPDDSLFIAGAIAGVVVVTWFFAALLR